MADERVRPPVLPRVHGAPAPMGDEMEHYWLVQRVAKATGIDLVQAMERGVLEQARWAEIVTSCRSCHWTDGCARWLEAHTEAKDAEDRPLPGPCLNRRRLAQVKADLGEISQREE
ncbi:DUF6455 family protein [Sagittula salina]|uniref:DUF6455 domain-containing protein n=1 Tax=Sagittula salina TaxID=2820268 RepID=A0A940MPN9_9RHOB|nr:DUF6455 family protein [Sagittula salina]MBP0482446.1 hypothetical protein [Sagittula salina]